MKITDIKDVEARKALVIPYEEYRGLTIFLSFPGYFNVAEFPHWDDIFDNLAELKEYIDYCLD